jgi:3,4-dihydroxy-2-butanone 4-phosphate synthase
MDDFLKRQLSLIQQAVSDYRTVALSLNQLVQRVEAIGNAIGGKLWEERLFEIVVDLERVNSEIIDKDRQMTLGERERVMGMLSQLEGIAAGL